MRTDPRSWRPSEHIDLANDAEVNAWAARLCVTPGELREIIEEMGDRTVRVAIEVSVPTRPLVKRDLRGMPRAETPE